MPPSGRPSGGPFGEAFGNASCDRNRNHRTRAAPGSGSGSPPGGQAVRRGTARSTATLHLGRWRPPLPRYAFGERDRLGRVERAEAADRSTVRRLGGNPACRRKAKRQHLRRHQITDASKAKVVARVTAGVQLPPAAEAKPPGATPASERPVLHWEIIVATEAHRLLHRIRMTGSHAAPAFPADKVIVPVAEKPPADPTHVEAGLVATVTLAAGRKWPDSIDLRLACLAAQRPPPHRRGRQQRQ